MNPNVTELARLCSYPLTRRWQYEWVTIEDDLGFTFPTEYKEFVSYFPPGVFGGVFIPVHPALREGGLTLPRRVRLLADLYRDWPNAERPARPFYRSHTA